jgi:DNA-binding NarL/FixJ family response regulator
MQRTPEEVAEQSKRVSMGRQKRYQRATLVRITDDEYRQLTERAKQSGVSVSRLLVDSTLADNAFSKEKREHLETLILQRDWAINEVARVGNNLNQIARQLNSQRGTISTERVEEVLADTNEVLRDLRRYWEHGAAEE